VGAGERQGPVEFNEYYLKNRSFLFDVKILWMTFIKWLFGGAILTHFRLELFWVRARRGGRQTAGLSLVRKPGPEKRIYKPVFIAAF